MKMEGIPFGTTDWASIPRTEHKGTIGTACWRTANFGSIRVRMVEYSPGYEADHWCSKGHILLCLEGELETELEDGRTLHFNGLFTVPTTRMSSDLPHQLGCALEHGPVGSYLRVNELKETSVPGVFACGDTARGFSNVAMAVGDGAMTGASVHRSLVFDH